MSTISTGKSTGVSKMVRDKNQRILMELVSQPGNDVCADCKAKAPRWASHNLGIFICVHCASVHRKIGTHITKVKSLTLDDWTKEQVENMKAIGNVKANQYWNPDETKHPLPTNMEESERDSEIEKYIRSKYEFQRFRPLSSRVAEKLGPPQSLQSRTPNPNSQSRSQLQSSDVLPPKRSQTAPIRVSSVQTTSQPPIPNAPGLDMRSFSSGSAPLTPPSTSRPEIPAQRSGFNPFPPSGSTSTSVPSRASAPAPANQQASLTSSTFNDLIALQAPSLNPSLPLQYASPAGTGERQQQIPQNLSQPFQVPMTTGLSLPFQSPSAIFSSSPFGTPTGGITSNPYASNFELSSTATSPSTAPFSPTPSSNFRSATFPQGFGQSPPNGMLSGPPNAFQQQFNTSPNFNPFTQTQIQSQQYPGTPLECNTPTLVNSQSSPFFTQQPPQQQQQAFQPDNAFQTPTPFSTQAQQAQQIFQGMTPNGAGVGTGTNNPFAR